MRVLQATQQTSRHDCFHSAIGVCALPQAPLWPTVLAGQAHEGIIGGAEGVADHDVSDTALDRIGAQACGLSQDVGAGGGLLGGSAGGARESREVPPQGLGRQVFSSAISIRVPVVGQSIFESYSGAAGAKYADMAAITSRIEVAQLGASGIQHI